VNRGIVARSEPPHPIRGYEDPSDAGAIAL
jgi:hypothetical protein